MGADNPLYDREAQTVSLEIFCMVQALKRAKDPICLRAIETHPVVPNIVHGFRL